MQSGTAISCDLGEISITAGMSNKCDDCRKDLQTKCGLQGKVVSHVECNAPDPKKPRERVCEGCCQVPLPCPVQPPAKWTQCPVTDTDKTFKIEHYSGNDCQRCKDGCKTRCDSIGAGVGDQICGYLDNGKTYVGLYCTCCCRKKAPLPPPTPSPPPPPPSPPPPAPENICKPEDMYLAFRLSNPQSCNSCSSDCKAKCSQMGSFMTTQQCSTESSPRLCKCCCKTPQPSPPPTPTSPSLPPPAGPALSCDYLQAQAIARHECKGQDTSFCESKCKSLSTALVVGGSGCEQNPADPTNSYCVCCYELDMCDSGSSLSSFSSKLLFKGLRQ
ncbi:hypothetical protein MKW92_029023 [Papaver armeniacum]|nr:hypothetical protein MKW92_029023 [Papaver armeniacum]